MKTTTTLFSTTMFFLATPLLALGAKTGDGTIKTILTLWPYMTGLILVLLAFLWYQQIRLWIRKKQGETRRHTARGNQLTMLSLVTIFALLMLAAPRFLKRFDYSTTQTEQTMNPENKVEVTLQVEGMTCTGCENAVQNRVAGLPGVESVKADHTAKQTTVVYDKSLTNLEDIAESINDAGYKVVNP